MTDTTAPDAITQAEKIADAVAAALAKYAVAYSHVTLADFSTAARTWSVHETGHGNPFVHDVWLGRFDNKAEADALASKLRREEAVEAVRRLAAHGAGEGLREAAAKVVEDYDTFSGDPHCDAVRDVMAVECAERIRALPLTPPSDAGSTTREGGKGVREALSRAISVTAYNRADPLAIRLEFATDADRVRAADALDGHVFEASPRDQVIRMALELCHGATDDCTDGRKVFVDPDDFDALNAALDAAESVTPPSDAGSTTREGGEGVHGLGPNALTIEDEPDGFDPVALLIGGNVYLQQGAAQIFLGLAQSARLAVALARPSPEAPANRQEAGEVEVTPRRLLDDDEPDGYRESDHDYVANNMAACVAYLDARAALSASNAAQVSK